MKKIASYKKVLILSLLFILLTSFNLIKPVFFGSYTSSNFKVYDPKKSLVLDCKYGVYNYRNTVIEKFSISKEINKISIIPETNCHRTFYENTIISKIGTEIQIKGRIIKRIARDGFFFFGTSYEIFTLDASTMHFSSIYKRETKINDFTIVNDKLYIATDKGIEIVSNNKTKKISFKNPIKNIRATTGKKHIIINEEGTQSKKRILKVKNLKEKIKLKKSNLLKNLLDITSDNKGITFNTETKMISFYNLKKESLIKSYRIPTEVDEKINRVKILDYKKNELTLKVFIKKGNKYSSKLQRFNIRTGEISLIEFDDPCSSKKEIKHTR